MPPHSSANTSTASRTATASRRTMRGSASCAKARKNAATMGRAPLLRLPVDLLDRLQQLDGVRHRPLERVAAHDRAERAAVGDALDLGEHLVGALRLAAGEDHDAPAA